MKKRLMKLFRREEGASIVEYALLVALIAIVAIVGINAAGVEIAAGFQALAGRLSGIAWGG
jgi:pilus assembly protein Flp/PilA